MATEFPPRREANLVTFTQNFSAKISSSPVTYSLTAAQATAYGTLSSAFVNAYAVANAGATRSPMNISLKSAAKDSLLANLRMLARIVQNAPTTTNAMRDDLGLPHRGTLPGPRPMPGTPNRFTVTLDASGALTLKWKCDNPAGTAGTIYQVWRRIGATGDFVYVGASGLKMFVDGTIPAGSSQVTYQIQAVRTTGAGPWAQFNVNFGTSSSTPVVSEATAEAAPLRRAA